MAGSIFVKGWGVLRFWEKPRGPTPGRPSRRGSPNLACSKRGSEGNGVELEEICHGRGCGIELMDQQFSSAPTYLGASPFERRLHGARRG